MLAKIKTCSVEGCENLVHARGWCIKHYYRWKAHGDSNIVLFNRAENGEPLEYLKAHMHDGCSSEWPFAKGGMGLKPLPAKVGASAKAREVRWGRDGELKQLKSAKSKKSRVGA